MTMTNDTATILSEDDLQRIYTQSIEAYPGVAKTDIRTLIASHRALTEQVRVLRETLEGIAVTLEHENDPFLERDNAHDLLADIRDITDTALAALEGEQS